MHPKGTSFGAPALIFFAIPGVSLTRLPDLRQKIYISKQTLPSIVTYFESIIFKGVNH
jgi:hypothetical protein